MFEGPLPYHGRAVVARNFLGPGSTDHFGAHLPSHPLRSTPPRSTDLKVGPLNPSRGFGERCQLY